METVHEIWCPEYDARFHCKGGACRSSCCTGWGISLTQDEYFLDYMQRDMSSFIEMKSGKADEYAIRGKVEPKENNKVQMLSLIHISALQKPVRHSWNRRR